MSIHLTQLTVAPLGVRETVEIGLVGVGPRGLSVLERLCANAGQTPDRSVKIHLVDPHIGAGGRVWRADQSRHLLMNTVASQVTMFVDESVDCAGPVVAGPSLHQWARVVALFLPGLPVWVREEALGLGPDTYPTRAFYGHYLRWVLNHVIKSAPANVSVVCHADQAVDLVDDEGGLQTVMLESGDHLVGLHAVILALGHLGVVSTPAEKSLAGYARREGLHYVEPGNPADADLDGIAAGEPVILRGMGLNFFDHLAMLTAGRGGVFVREDHGLRYEPSGSEPVLIAGSRRGIPYHARGENQKGPFGRHMPLFLTEERIARMRASGQLDFLTDIWPWVDREVRSVYYAALVTERGDDAAKFIQEFVSTEDEERLLHRYGFDEDSRWDWGAIAFPDRGVEFAGPDDHRAWMLSYLRQDVREARCGNVSGPLKAALDVLRDLRNEVRLLVDHGGLTGDSYRDQLDGWYTPLNAFLSIGPPVHRIEEAIALIEAGVLTVLGPDMVVECGDDGLGFRTYSPRVPGAVYRARALVEARLPEIDARRTTDPLLSRLFMRKACALNRIPNRDGGHYETGGIAVAGRPYALLDGARRPHPRRFAFGVPTETVHWATAAGVRPGVNSVILGDADALARQSLSLAEQMITEPVTA
ncbi:FAD/NAD(P)-binding protein [Lentzea sp. BCCO 10_0856]|uniref:FAD/NAD(P)-binding protein n=1 Tax=Lentzea miocenica TaxID=3095431 RepID=A0ABU4TFS2_9PSEU|nr:FAD/NAD(P)-binding protein [Lentzea sp. BCCO 10_0856]MDX8036743.1 FAD/NAD(P)-binding protein [Lentzea sp. BCCO 10_0856]